VTGATPLGVLDVGAVDGIAELCRRTMDAPPSGPELADCLFAADRPALVRGDPEVGVVASARTGDGAFVKLLAVDPAAQRRGHGTRLLQAAEDDLRDASGNTTVTVGADAPYYLFPGVETSQRSMLCLLERRHYSRHEANYNMDVDLDGLPPDPGGSVLAGPGDAGDLERFTRDQWPNWHDEVMRALGRRTVTIARDDGGIRGFCAWDVNRRGLVGPVAVRLDLMGKGAGMPLLLGALHRIRSEGRPQVEISWVGPILPYARVGARVGRVFFVYRRTW
jgi:GNAT superfamily N-acetyltransferase